MKGSVCTILPFVWGSDVMRRCSRMRICWTTPIKWCWKLFTRVSFPPHHHNARWPSFAGTNDLKWHKSWVVLTLIRFIISLHQLRLTRILKNKEKQKMSEIDRWKKMDMGVSKSYTNVPSPQRGGIWPNSQLREGPKWRTTPRGTRSLTTVFYNSKLELNLKKVEL